MDLLNLYHYGFISFLLLIGLLTYLKIAEKWSIIDQPNNRSHIITLLKEQEYYFYLD